MALSEEPKEKPSLFQRVQAIASAIKAYQTKEKRLPTTLEDLCQKYLKSNQLWLESKDHPNLPFRLFYHDKMEIPDPDGLSAGMLAFTTLSENGMRFVVDTNFEVWHVGERKFQDWLAGVRLSLESSRLQPK